MSEVYHGIIIPAALSDARAEFTKLASGLTLRLVSFSETVQGVYSRRFLRRTDHTLAELAHVGKQFSTEFEFALLYFYDSCKGFDFALFESGRQTKTSKDPHSYSVFDDGEEFKDPFAIVERLGLNDDIVEEAFHWSQLDAVLHNQPNWEVAKERYPVGSRVRGKVSEQLENRGFAIDLGNDDACGFVGCTAYGRSREIAADNFPEVGQTLDLVVDSFSDEWEKAIFLQPHVN